MSTQKRKFELFARLQALGFTYDESAALRRIEMTLQRWGEHECNGDIQRDEATDKPYRVYEQSSSAKRYPVADREAGALRRLKAIVWARNGRVSPPIHVPSSPAKIQEDPKTRGQLIEAYHQGDCRGCMLYLVTREQLTDRQTGAALPIDSYYNRGLAVCA
jgi:hypothetical protein